MTPEPCLPATYREQNGCHNCAKLFLKTDYDSYPEYYCTLNAPPRPICMSVGMNETGHDLGDDYGDHEAFCCRSDEWRAWSESREVRPQGICEHWTEQ